MKASPTATKAIALTMWLVEAVLCMGFILITLLPSAPGALRVTRESWLSHDVTGMLATSFFVITIPAAAYFAAVGFRFFWRHLTQKGPWEPQKATIFFMSSALACGICIATIICIAYGLLNVGERIPH